MADDDAGELSMLAYYMGFVMGSLMREEVADILMERGVKGTDIEMTRKLLRAISQAFYDGR